MLVDSFQAPLIPVFKTQLENLPSPGDIPIDSGRAHKDVCLYRCIHGIPMINPERADSQSTVICLPTVAFHVLELDICKSCGTQR